MKVSNIFSKNLKTISRNWSYFFILVFFPLFLIVIAGGILDSINVNNVDIMFSTDDPTSGIEGFEEFQSYYTYADLNFCLERLKMSKVGACLYLRNLAGVQVLDVYYDGSDKFIEQYTKQMVLDKISKKQGEILEKTAEQITENIKSYKVLFAETKDKLIETRDDLTVQKSDLNERKKEVEDLRDDYLEIYYPMKESEDDFFRMKAAIEENKEDMDSGFDALRTSTDSMKQVVSDLRSSGLDSLQNGYVNELEAYVYNVDIFLDLYEETYGSDAFMDVLNSMAELYPKLDEIKDILDKTIEDLDDAIEGIDETIVDIEDYLDKLDVYSISLDEFSEEADHDEFRWNFISGLDVTDPVLLSFPLLVSIIIMFTSIVLPNMITSKQTHENSYFREMVSPVKKRSFLIANYFVNLFFIFIQAVVLLLVGLFWVGIPLASVGLFFVGIFLVSTVFIFIGMSIAYFIRVQALSSLVTIFVVLFSLMISAVVAPPLLTSYVVNVIMNLNPFVILLNFLKEIFVLGHGFSEMLPDIMKICIYVVIFGFILILSKQRHDQRVG